MQTPESSRPLSLLVPGELVEALAHRVVELLDERRHTIDGGKSHMAWLDVDEAASHLACKPQRIYDLVSQGALRPARDGRRVLFRREWLDDYVTRLLTVDADNPGAAPTTLASGRDRQRFDATREAA